MKTNEISLPACRNCGGQCDPTGWMCGDGRQGPECEGCGITTPDVESWKRLMAQSAPEPVQGEAVEVVAWANPSDLVEDGYGHSFGVSSSEYPGRVPLMSVAQHNRIMAAAKPDAELVALLEDCRGPVIDAVNNADCQANAELYNALIKRIDAKLAELKNWGFN